MRKFNLIPEAFTVYPSKLKKFEDALQQILKKKISNGLKIKLINDFLSRSLPLWKNKKKSLTMESTNALDDSIASVTSSVQSMGEEEIPVYEETLQQAKDVGDSGFDTMQSPGFQHFENIVTPKKTKKPSFEDESTLGDTVDQSSPKDERKCKIRPPRNVKPPVRYGLQGKGCRRKKRSTPSTRWPRAQLISPLQLHLKKSVNLKKEMLQGILLSNHHIL
jgi:hypothetical protein